MLGMKQAVEAALKVCKKLLRETAREGDMLTSENCSQNLSADG